MGKQWKPWQTLFSWAPKSLQMVTAVKKLKDAYDKPRKHIEKQKHHFASKGLYSQSYGFSSSHIWMWELDHKEGWVPENWCFWTVVGEDSWESLGQQGDQISSILREINPEYSLEGLTLKLKLQYSSHLMERADSLEKTLMLGMMEGKRRKGWQLAGWHHWHNGHEFEQTQGDSEGQGSLVCCSPWWWKELDTT